VDLAYFLVAELAKSFGFPCKNGAAESLGDFRYGLSPRHLIQTRWNFAGRRPAFSSLCLATGPVEQLKVFRIPPKNA